MWMALQGVGVLTVGVAAQPSRGGPCWVDLGGLWSQRPVQLEAAGAGPAAAGAAACVGGGGRAWARVWCGRALPWGL